MKVGPFQILLLEVNLTIFQAKNEKLLESLVNQCNNGIFGTMAQAVDELDTPRVKHVRPFKSYDGPLTLGDPEQYQSAASIHVERYFKTKIAAPISATTVALRSELAGGQSQSTHTLDGDDVVMGGTAIVDLKTHRDYKVDDPDAPGGKRDVDFDELAKGYEYGRTVVHISESDWNVTKLQTKRSLTILGFVPWSSVCHLLHLSSRIIL